MEETLTADPKRDTLANSILKAAGISGDDLKSLAGLFKEVASGLSTKLGKMSPTAMETELSSLDTIDRDDALALVTSQTALSIVTVESWGSKLIFVADRTFVFTAVDLLFGANEDVPAFETDRPFTAIELNLVDKVFRTLVIALDQAFSGGTSSLFKMADVTNPERFDRETITDTRVTACRIKLKAFGRSGTLTIVFPRSSYRAMHEAMARLLQEPSNRTDPEWAKKLRSEVARSKVDVEAYLEQGKMTLEQIGRLVPGGVIRLPAGAFGHARLRSGGQPLFNCALGKSGNAFTVRITDPVDNEEDFINDLTAG